MSTASYHLRQVEPVDLSWMGDEESPLKSPDPCPGPGIELAQEAETCDQLTLDEEWLRPLPPAPTWRAPAEEPPAEPLLAPTLHALVQVESGIASVVADAGVNVVVVDWDVIDEEGAEALYVAYEQVRTLGTRVPERDDTLEALESRLQECPSDEVAGLHALTDEITPDEGPAVLVIVRDGISSEHAAGVEVEWIDWDFIAADEDGSQHRVALSSLTNLPDDFPGRRAAEERLTA